MDVEAPLYVQVFTLINQFILNNVSLYPMRGWRRFNSNVHHGIEAKLQCFA